MQLLGIHHLTAISAAILATLNLPPRGGPRNVAGVGGAAAAVEVETFLRLFTDSGSALFRDQWVAFTELEALDMSVLGRDVMNLFAVIVDRPREVVCLISQGHDYDVVRRP